MKSLHPWASRSSRRASWEKLLNKAPYFLSDSRAHRMDGHIWPSWGLYVASKCWRARLVGGCLGRVAAFPRRNKLFTNFKWSQEHIKLFRTLGFSLKKNDLVIKSLLCIISKIFWHVSLANYYVYPIWLLLHSRLTHFSFTRCRFGVKHLKSLSFLSSSLVSVSSAITVCNR